MSIPARIAQVVLVLIGLLSVVFSISVYAAPAGERFDPDANALIASWGVGFGVLTIVLATLGLSSGRLWPWAALWVLPAFLVSHVVLLGTALPDGVLAVVAVLALVAVRPRERSFS